MTKLYIGSRRVEDDSEHLGRLGQSDREEILSEVWAAKKKLIDGKWYVELSEVANIIGS
jgi:GH43 family beta-xylosidase